MGGRKGKKGRRKGDMRNEWVYRLEKKKRAYWFCEKRTTGGYWWGYPSGRKKGVGKATDFPRSRGKRRNMSILYSARD